MSVLKINNEFSRLISAIVHDGENIKDISMDDWRARFTKEQLAEHPEIGPVVRSCAIEELSRVHTLLREHGVELAFAATQPNATAQVFARDPSFVIGTTFYLASLQDDYRMPETLGLRGLYEGFADYINLRDKDTNIEGGDILVLSPKTVLAGRGPMTNEAGARKLAVHLDEISGTHVIEVPHTALHLDCCLTPLPNGEAFAAMDFLPEASLAALKQIFTTVYPLDPYEATHHLAANIFWLNEREVMANRNTPILNQNLRERGYQVHELDLTHITRKWGGVRCLISPLSRDA